MITHHDRIIDIEWVLISEKFPPTTDAAPPPMWLFHIHVDGHNLMFEFFHEVLPWQCLHKYFYLVTCILSWNLPDGENWYLARTTR